MLASEPFAPWLETSEMRRLADRRTKFVASVRGEPPAPIGEVTSRQALDQAAEAQSGIVRGLGSDGRKAQ